MSMSSIRLSVTYSCSAHPPSPTNPPTHIHQSNPRYRISASVVVSECSALCFLGVVSFLLPSFEKIRLSFLFFLFFFLISFNFRCSPSLIPSSNPPAYTRTHPPSHLSTDPQYHHTHLLSCHLLSCHYCSAGLAHILYTTAPASTLTPQPNSHHRHIPSTQHKL